jgi:hypothetical protein
MCFQHPHINFYESFENLFNWPFLNRHFAGQLQDYGIFEELDFHHSSF